MSWHRAGRGLEGAFGGWRWCISEVLVSNCELAVQGDAGWQQIWWQVIKVMGATLRAED